MQLREADLDQVMHTVQNYSVDRVHTMRRQVQFLWRTYFSSISAITMATLHVLNGRIFPYAARSYHDWNEPPDMVSQLNYYVYWSDSSEMSEGKLSTSLTYLVLKGIF